MTGAALVLAVVVAACGGPPGAVTATPSGEPPVAPSASVAQAGTPAPDPNAPEVNAAGDIPDSQVFVPFRPTGAAFTVSVPQGWARSDDHGDAVFTDKLNSVRIHSGQRAGTLDAASVRAQDVPAVQAATPGFALGDVQQVGRRAGTAILMTYTAPSPPNPVTGKSVTEEVERYAFGRAGQEVVVTLSAPKGADNVDPWRTVTDSFRWL